MLETVLKTGREAGFSTVEAFAEKILRQERAGVDQPLSLHEVQGDRVRVRAFRDSGDPLGFSLSSPDARQVKRCFAALAHGSGPDGKKNFAQLLPKSVPKNKPDIYDPGIEAWEEDPAETLRERIMESLVTFPGLKLKKFIFSRVLKKVYLANSRGFLAKYKKTHFQILASFLFRDHALELSESRVYCKDFDPGRLVARGSNLLGALSADRECPGCRSRIPGHVARGLGPGAEGIFSAAEARPGGGQGARHRRFSQGQHPGQSRPGRPARLRSLR